MNNPEFRKEMRKLKQQAIVLLPTLTKPQIDHGAKEVLEAFVHNLTILDDKFSNGPKRHKDYILV